MNIIIAMIMVIPHRDVVVVRNIPHHVGVLPCQIKPHVGGQDLIFLIQIYDLLQTKNKGRSLLHWLHWPKFYLQDSKFQGNTVVFRGYGSLQVVVVSKEVLDEQLLMFSCRHPLTVMEEREEEPAPAQPRHHWAQQSSLLPPPGYVQVSPSNTFL